MGAPQKRRPRERQRPEADPFRFTVSRDTVRRDEDNEMLPDYAE